MESIARAVRYVLGSDDLFLNTSSDARLLSDAINAASGDLRAPDDAAMAADVDHFGISPIFADGALERI